MSLLYKAQRYVANELASNRLPPSHNDDTVQVRIARWNKLADEAMPEVEAVINAMTHFEFLKLLSDVLEEVE